MDPNQLLLIILLIIGLNYLWSEVLDYLNLKAHRREVPAEFSDHYDEEKYQQGYAYHQTNYRFSLVRGLLSLILTLLVLGLGWLGLLDSWLRQQFELQGIPLTLSFFAIIYLASDLLSLPFQLYHTFVIEEKFGFNKTSPATFVKDKLKGYLLSMIMGGLVLGVLLTLVQELGEGFWLWFWLFMTAFSLFMATFYSSWIMPLFNKFTPLEAGELRDAIMGYAQQVNFPLDNLFVIDGSRRSAKANAFFTGLGRRKRVVLYDTLIEQHSTEELVAVLAHEIGHYKRKHIIQSLVISTLQTGVILFVLSRFVFSPELSLALGGSQMAIHLNLIAFGLLFSPISTLLGVVLNQFSRKNEFEADAYAAQTFAAAPLREALIKLHQKNLSNLTPHPWYVFFNYSHPPLLQRLRALTPTEA
jgi:STE24 endopeptidase